MVPIINEEVRFLITEARNKVVREGFSGPLHCVASVHVGRDQLLEDYF